MSLTLGRPDSLTTWRYIPPLVAPGQMQMAIDTWLWQHHAQGLSPPCLRFYTWEPVAISYGYHQADFPPHWSELVWKNQPIQLVKRPTGGRAVLHQGDLTYAVVTTRLDQSRKAAYRELSQFLVQGWRQLGVNLAWGGEKQHYTRSVNCFGTATQADLILSHGYKLIGSAQAWKSATVLQHGSMRLHVDPDLWADVFQAPLEPMPQPMPSQADIISVLCQTAQDCFGITLEEQPLTLGEWQQIRQQPPSRELKAED